MTMTTAIPSTQPQQAATKPRNRRGHHVVTSSLSSLQNNHHHHDISPSYANQPQPMDSHHQHQDTVAIKSSPSSSPSSDMEYNSSKYRHHRHDQHRIFCSYPVIITIIFAVLYVIGRRSHIITFIPMNHRKMNDDNHNNDHQYHIQGTMTIIDDWEDHVENAKLYGQKYGWDKIQHPITAYIEPWYIWNDTIPNTGSRGNLKEERDIGTPPEFIIPMPLRYHTPDDLVKIVYNHSAKTCYDMPHKFPIDRGYEVDPITNQTIVRNVGDTPTSPDFPWEEAPYCPVEADPFLPWIHDIFPTNTSIHIIGQNKRKCRTGSKYTENVNRLIPQVTILQSVSVQRITDKQAIRDAPQLWHPYRQNINKKNRKKKNSKKHNIYSDQQIRYKLVPYDDADHDGMYTRFICQYYTTIYPNMKQEQDQDLEQDQDTQQQPQRVLIGETLSVYPFNYEYMSYRKGKKALLTPKGKDTTYFWTSNLHFECPIPLSLQKVMNGNDKKNHIITENGISTIYLDIIPIRTSVRYEEIYLTEDMIGPSSDWSLPAFDPIKRWGRHQILPRTEASGRWSNIPLCWIPPPPPSSNPPSSTKITTKEEVMKKEVTKKPSPYFDPSTLITPKAKDATTALDSTTVTTKKKLHLLSACLWASAAFRTRGMTRGADIATNDRLIEWIEFHLMVGFDHIYLYDNSGAHTNETNLQSVVDMYHPSQITRIDWPSVICNNNVPAADSCGERSTQYAAENSCRSRYAPYTEWIAAFDTDEYMVPMGHYTNWKEILSDVTLGGTNILSLRSSRGRLRIDHSTLPMIMKNDPKYSNRTSGIGFDKSNEALFLEAYNCDSAGSPKPTWGDRARKQIYRTDYVLYHFVHYSTVTQGYLVTYQNSTDQHMPWHRLYGESQPSERASDELYEAVLVHTKSLGKDITSDWQHRCLFNHTKKWQGCWAAIPWPMETSYTDVLNKNYKHKPYDMNGYEYNCFINYNVENYWIPKLKQAMQQRQQLLQENEKQAALSSSTTE